MKKLISIAAGAAAFCALGAYAFADSIEITIADENGKIAVSTPSMDVEDADGDGKLTVNDALITAHENFYEGGAEAGYACETGDYGLMLTRLWGTENGGSYGYYVNNTASMSLGDEIKDGDSVYAFVYTDLQNWSDTYCWFDERNSDNIIKADETLVVPLVLSGAGFDADWNPVTVPVGGAELTVNGERTGIITDEEGRAEIEFTEDGSYLISAVSDSQTLVPPVCRVNVDIAPDTSDSEESEAEVGAELDVYVSIADANGDIVVANRAVTTPDINSDGKITIDEALYTAHENFYEGGAAAGYASETGDYGLMLTKLWGTENGGSYGYYVNNVSAMSLGDELSGGEAIYAFVYTDLETWSDKYCWFEMADAVTVKLTAASFDENWNPVNVPVEGAYIIIDDIKTDITTDAEGKAKLENLAAYGIGDGDHLVTAASDTMTLVPPILNISVIAPTRLEEEPAPAEQTPVSGDVSAAASNAKASPDTGIEDTAAVFGIALLALGALAVTKKKSGK